MNLNLNLCSSRSRIGDGGGGFVETVAVGREVRLGPLVRTQITISGTTKDTIKLYKIQIKNNFELLRLRTTSCIAVDPK